MTTVSEICVNAVRGLLIADEGKKLVVADLSNIEGRVAAWVAGEEWKLQAFRDFDTIIGTDADGEPIRKGHDLYKIGAGRILGKRPEDVTKLERQNEGKVPELACFGARTIVVTRGGLKNMKDVLPDDQLWDGVEWVKHQGLIDRGRRKVMMLDGVQVTPDHRVLAGETWLSAEMVGSSQTTLDLALATGTASLQSLTSIEATSPETYVSPPNAPTATTSARSETCKPRSTGYVNVFDIVNAGPRNRFTIISDHGALVVHNCQFQGAVGAFATMGANFGVVLPEERVIEIVKAWRKSHPRIVSTWYAIEDAAKAAIRFPDERFEVNGFLCFDSVDGWLRIRLPSGHYLSYPKARVGEVCHRCGGSGQHLESGVANATKMVVCLDCDGSGKADTQLRYDGVDQYTKKWGTIRTYGGKIFENCIAAGTLTLTDAGWLPIEQVRVDHRLWDGEEWVRHEGLAFKGVQEVIAAHGVMMTPDHEILTTEGWVSASQSKRYNRASCRLPGSTELRGGHGQETLHVERRVCLRKDISDGCVGSVETAKNRQQSLLWMPQERDDRRKEHQARYVSAPCLRGLAKYARQVSVAVSQGVEELRRARDFGVRALAEVFLCLLGGYGADLRERAHAGPYRQQRRVFAGKLPMGFTQKTSAQQTGQHNHRHPVGSFDGGRSSGTRQPEQDDAALPSIYRCEGLAPVYSAEPFQPVLDVVNCGPRQRFVVLSSDGRPLIVHNCVQAIARDVFMCGFRAAEREGYAVVSRVHDELITEVPDDPRYNAGRLSALMATNPPWAVGLPLAAAGHEMYRYAKLD